MNDRQHPHPRTRTRDIQGVAAPTTHVRPVMSPDPHAGGGVQPYRHSRKKLLLLVLPILILLLGGGAYAAINLTANKPAQHSSLKPGINIDQGQKGLVGWWKLNGNTKDSTPYADDGINNSATPTPTTDRKGTANGAMAFDGASNFINVNDSAALDPTTAYTVTAWVKPNFVAGSAGDTNYEIVDKMDFGNNVGYRMLLGGYGGFRNTLTCVAGNGTTKGSLTSSRLTDTNHWYHIACVYDAGVMTAYVDGAPSGSANLGFSSIVNTTGVLSIGHQPSGGEFCNCNISDVRLYNRALSQSDITNLYNSYNSQVNIKPAGASTPGVNLGAGLVGWWPFAGNANDSTPYGNNGTVLGAALTTGHTGLANHAYSFSGTKTSQITAGRDSSALGLSGDFTLSAWIDPTSYHTTGFFGLMNEFIVRGSNNQSESTINYALQATDDHTIAFMKRSGTEGIMQYRFIGVPTLTNRWTMVTVTVSGTTLTLYINGQPFAHPLTLGGNPIAPGSDDILVLGGGNVSSEVPFTGGLDSVRIYNRALSAAEVFALYDLPD